MVLLSSCTGSPGHGSAGSVTSANAASANAAMSAAASAAACLNQSSGVTGFDTTPDLGVGSRVLLGRIAVATGYFGNPVLVSGNGPWRYWEKRPIKVLAGSGRVVISVPPSWRQRVAITYGTNGTVSSLAVTACQQPSGVWDAYAGGIYLSATAACVPLVFTMGNQSVTVRFSMYGRCG